MYVNLLNITSPKDCNKHVVMNLTMNEFNERFYNFLNLKKWIILNVNYVTFLRTYYKGKVIIPAPKDRGYPKKLVYQFGTSASGWRMPECIFNTAVVEKDQGKIQTDSIILPAINEILPNTKFGDGFLR